jgi:23S rRNA pseudouridine1911/1915/1917 synthase
MNERIEIKAPLEAAGQRLDVFLASVPEIGSRTAAQRLIEAGRTTIDDAAGSKSARLRGGETIVVAPSDAEGVGYPGGGSKDHAPYEIVWEDEHLMIVDKPAHVVVHPAPGHESGTLAQALAARGASGGEPWRPGIAHRLDKGTSGLLAVAKSDTVLRALQEALQGRQVERSYVALVRGRPASRSGTVDAPVGRDREDRKKISIGAPSSRPAVTHFETLEELARCTLLGLRLETGRTHQIRVHLAAIGLPVCGDAEYGEAGSYGLTRQFLHAARLRLRHPVTGDEIVVESPLPADLREALAAARIEGTG